MSQNDEEYELMQSQNEEHIYCEVLDDRPIIKEIITGHRRNRSTSNILANNESTITNNDKQSLRRESWSTTDREQRDRVKKQPQTSSLQKEVEDKPIKRPRSPKPKPRLRLIKARSTNSIDVPTQEELQQFNTPPPPVTVSLNSQLSTGFGFQLKDISNHHISPAAPPNHDHTDTINHDDPTYINIIDTTDMLNTDTDDVIYEELLEGSIISELTASRKKEEMLLKRLDEQDKKINNLEISLQNLKAEFKHLLHVLINTEEPKSPICKTELPLKQPPCVFVMPQFSQYLYTPGKEWYSEPFHTSQMGYKMCLQVVAHGLGTSAGKDVSICIRLMKGEFDHQLMFPFYGDISVSIINHIGDYKHANRIISFGGEAMKYGACRRVRQGTCDQNNSELAELGWGISAFIPHIFLPYNEEQKTEFVKNDSLTIKVTNLMDSNIYVNT